MNWLETAKQAAAKTKATEAQKEFWRLWSVGRPAAEVEKARKAIGF